MKEAINKYLRNEATIVELAEEYKLEKDQLRKLIYILTHDLTLDELKNTQVLDIQHNSFLIEIKNGIITERMKMIIFNPEHQG